MSDDDIQPVKGPQLDLPTGSSVCSVSVVDTTCCLTVGADTLVEPTIRGHEYMNFPTYAFLIKHVPTGRHVMYDLGCQKDYWNLPPPLCAIMEDKVPGIKVDENVADILTDGGFDIQKLEAAIISHHHYDHMGDLTTFPRSMDVLVGPGFSKNFLPGYPTAEHAPAFEDAFKERNVRELDFSDAPTVAGYPAFDYFGDGSLFILDTPGHAVGHISALVRTTTDTFVFLGGDICHFGGSFRPTAYTPMPKVLSSEELGPATPFTSGCPCSVFLKCHPDPANARTSPYYKVCSREDTWYIEPDLATRSLQRLQELDASDQVLVLITHDPAIPGVIPLFPAGTLDSWRELGWKRVLRWQFVNELPIDDAPQKFLVSGQYRDGELIKAIVR